MRRPVLIISALAFVTACASPSPRPPNDEPARPEARPAIAAEDPPAADAARAVPESDGTSAAPPAAGPASAGESTAATPHDAPLEVESVRVPGDRSVYVVGAGAPVPRAIVYLHGKCGDPLAFRPWAAAASRHGTLVSIQGDVPCDNGRRRWSHDLALAQRRIDAALEAVSSARGVRLDARALTAIGYSEGAIRVEQLARRSPDRYPHVILAAGPVAPRATGLERARIVVLAGARDRREHLREAADAMAKAGLPVTFMLLPRAAHGDYGPEGERVMDAALEWLMIPP